jgi:hypothetical protein
MTDKNNDSIQLVDIGVTKECVDFIKSEFNSLMKEGRYGFDDVQKVIISINNMYRSLDALDKLQMLAIQIKQRQEQAAVDLQAQSMAQSMAQSKAQPSSSQASCQPACQGPQQVVQEIH